MTDPHNEHEGDGALSEGVGGVPDIDDDERATVGDVDGDNIEDGEELD
jgi:hypothetical protein